MVCTCVVLSPPAWGNGFTEIAPPDADLAAGFGNKIAILGDVDDDGIDDFAIADSIASVVLAGDTEASASVGAVHVYSGRECALLYTIAGDEAGERFGLSLAGGGDFDGDGVPDVAVGAPNRGAALQGNARVYDGADGSLIATLEADALRDSARMGFSLDFVGRIGFGGDVGVPLEYPGDTLVVSAPGEALGFQSTLGRAFLFATKTVSDGLGGTIDVIDRHVIPDTILDDCCDPEGLTEELFGSTVASAADFNDDGTPDILIATRARQRCAGCTSRRGRGFVLSGADLETVLLNEVGVGGNVFYGAGATLVGDFDGSGRPAVMFGAPQFTRVQNDPFTVFSAAGYAEIFAWDANAGAPERLLRIEGSHQDRLWDDAAFVGDFDGDGIDDALGLGSTEADIVILAGSDLAADIGAEILFEDGDREIFDRDDARIPDVVDNVGWAIGHDFNGDGISELLLSDANSGPDFSPRVYALFTKEIFAGPPDSVSVTTPTDGDHVAGDVILSADVVGDATAVTFLLDGVDVGSDDQAPFSIVLDTDDPSGGIADGHYELIASAVNGTSDAVESAVVNIVVDNTAPTKVLTRPADGRRVRKLITVRADADDDGSGVARMTVFVDGVEVGTSEPGANVVRVGNYDTRDHLDGPLEIRCKVEDAVGNRASDSITVIVNNWRKRIVPGRIKNSSPGDGPVQVRFSGITVDTLLEALQGADPPTIQLRLGGTTVTALDHEDTVNSKNQLHVDFDRLDFLTMASADLAARGKLRGKVKPELLLDGVVIATLAHYIRK